MGLDRRDETRIERSFDRRQGRDLVLFLQDGADDLTARLERWQRIGFPEDIAEVGQGGVLDVAELLLDIRRRDIERFGNDGGGLGWLVLHEREPVERAADQSIGKLRLAAEGALLQYQYV